MAWYQCAPADAKHLEWLRLTAEAVLEPELAIIDPHHLLK